MPLASEPDFVAYTPIAKHHTRHRLLCLEKGTFANLHPVWSGGKPGLGQLVDQAHIPGLCPTAREWGEQVSRPEGFCGLPSNLLLWVPPNKGEELSRGTKGCSSRAGQRDGDSWVRPDRPAS